MPPYEGYGFENERLKPIPPTYPPQADSVQRRVEADAALVLLAPRSCLRSGSCFAVALPIIRRAA